MANNYLLQLNIYKETVRLDKDINVDYFAGAGVEGLEAGDHSAFTFNFQLVFWQQDAVLW